MDTLEKKTAIPKYAYVIVLLSFVISFIGNYPQFQLSPLAYLIIPGLNLSIPQFASLFSAPMIPGIFLSLVAGMLSDRFGVKRTVGIAGIISLISVVARIWWGTTSFAGLFVCMMFSGLVAAFNNANYGKMMGTWFPPKRVGVMVGIGTAGATSAMAIGMGTSALLPSVKYAYSVAAVLSAVSVVLWYVLMKEKNPNAVKELDNAVKPTLGECIKVSVKNKFVWIVALCMGLTFVPSMCLSMFLPQALVASRGIEAAAAGGIASAIMFGNLFGAFIGPIICARLGRTKLFIFACLLITAVGSAFGWLTPVGGVMLVCLFLTGFAISSALSQMISVPVMLKGIGPVYAGTAGGIVATIQLIIGVVLPSYVLAPIIGANFTLLFLVAGVLAVVGAVLSLLLPELFKKKEITK